MEKQPSYWINETSVPQKKRLILDKDMIRSAAFVGLTGAAKQMLLELYMRLSVDCLKAGRNRKEAKYYAKNNGLLVLRYSDVKKMFGYSSATISKAIDGLCNRGFIEIAELGCGAMRQSHKIALITNWRDYGKPDFRPGIGKADRPFRGGFKKNIPLETKPVLVQKLNKVGT